MFGYIKACRNELKVCEDNIYSGAYCGLCKALGRNYGQLSRLTLSYDLSFLVLILLSVSNEKIYLEKKRCGFNILKKKFTLNFKNTVYEYATAVSSLLSYNKILDNIDDSKWLKGLLFRCLKLIFRRKYQKAVKKYPLLKKIGGDLYNNQKKIEKSNNIDIDIAAEPTAKALMEIFSLGAEKYKEQLGRIGYLLGKYIYLLDAVDDYKKDKEKGGFNPLFYDKDIGKNASFDKIKEETEPVLKNCLVEAFEEYKQVETVRFRNIIENILILGIDKNTREIFKKGETDV